MAETESVPLIVLLNTQVVEKAFEPGNVFGHSAATEDQCREC